MSIITIVTLMMRKEARLKELIVQAGGQWYTLHDEVIAYGLTEKQWAAVLAQLLVEFPL